MLFPECIGLSTKGVVIDIEQWLTLAGYSSKFTYAEYDDRYDVSLTSDNYGQEFCLYKLREAPKLAGAWRMVLEELEECMLTYYEWRELRGREEWDESLESYVNRQVSLLALKNEMGGMYPLFRYQLGMA